MKDNRISGKETITDGYFDGGGSSKFDMNGNIISSNREIIIVDRTKDAKLASTIAEVKDATKGMSETEKAQYIADYVYKLCGNPYEALDNSNKLASNTPILLGDIVNSSDPMAVCRHRALLSKILGNEVGLEISLERGICFGQGRHAFNIVKFSDGTSKVLDAMNPNYNGIDVFSSIFNKLYHNIKNMPFTNLA